MARVIVFDSGPLNLACLKPGDPGRDALTIWRIQADSTDALLVIPEIADYEVRRELMRKNAQDNLIRLDTLCSEYRYLPITKAVMRRAAELWAAVRVQGKPTADDKALDGDAILAAQALCFVGHGDILTVATANHRHLSRFGLNAQSWQAISP